MEETSYLGFPFPHFDTLDSDYKTIWNVHYKMSIMWEVKVTQSCLTLCDPMDCTVHGILQARILEWVAFPFSRGSSQPRDQTQVSHIAGGFFTIWATREVYKMIISTKLLTTMKKKIRSGLFIFQQASIKWKGKTCLIKIKTHFDCHSFKDISLVNFVSEANSSLSPLGSLNWSPRTPRIGRGHGMKLHVWSKRTDERREKTHVSQLIIA